jgi:hypothetical protein
MKTQESFMKWTSFRQYKTGWVTRAVAASAVVFVAGTAIASERHSFYEGSRGRAMGGAQIAVVNDETALLVNPSALGKLRDVFGTVLDPEIEVSNNVNKMNSSSRIGDFFSVSGIKDSLQSNPERYYHAKMQLFPSVVTRNFGIGIYSGRTLDAQMNGDGTAIDVFSRDDLALVLGYNLRLADGRVKIGVNTKLLNRIEIKNSSVSPTGSLDEAVIGAAEGTGLSTDVSLMLAAPWVFLPTVTAVLHDVGGTSFDWRRGMRMTTANAPDLVPQDLDVGMALFPIQTNRVRSSFAIEYRSVLTADKEQDKAKLFHFGTELNFDDIFFLRAGYNQRYLTGGFEIASELLQFQVTSYGEEIGDQNNPKEDRRTMFKFALRF